MRFYQSTGMRSEIGLWLDRELLKTLGVPLMVDDLYSLDEYTLADMKPSALIFLFKWLPTHNVTSDPSTAGSYDPDFPGMHRIWVEQSLGSKTARYRIFRAPSGKSDSALLVLFNEIHAQ